jgi:hypothetical protein
MGLFLYFEDPRRSIISCVAQNTIREKYKGQRYLYSIGNQVKYLTNRPCSGDNLSLLAKFQEL